MDRSNRNSLLDDILDLLKSNANVENVKGMARFGINPENTLGISIPLLRNIKTEILRDYKNQPVVLHTLANDLWLSAIHEARILAAFIDVAGEVTEEQMEAWVKDFDSWDVCDQACGNLFDKTPFAFKKAIEWSARPEEFVKRAGFVLMATLSVHDKHAKDTAFLQFFPLMEREANDERNFVKKAVNWAIRQIGKRNKTLNTAAVELCKKIEKQNSKSAGWIAKNALLELQNEKILKNVHAKKISLPLIKKMK